MQYENYKKNEEQKKIEYMDINNDKKKKKTFVKISTPQTIEQAMKVLKERYPCFPDEFKDKLYTTDVLYFL